MAQFYHPMLNIPDATSGQMLGPVWSWFNLNWFAFARAHRKPRLYVPAHVSDTVSISQLFFHSFLD